MADARFALQVTRELLDRIDRTPSADECAWLRQAAQLRLRMKRIEQEALTTGVDPMGGATGYTRLIRTYNSLLWRLGLKNEKLRKEPGQEPRKEDPAAALRAYLAAKSAKAASGPHSGDFDPSSSRDRSDT